MDKPVLFLDVDGVLQSHRSALALGGISHPMDAEYVYLDPVAVGILKDFIHKTQPRVALHSTWRMQKKAITGLSSVLEYEIEATNARLDKVESINDFILKNEVNSYVVLEDHDLGFHYHQVLVDSSAGLQLKHLTAMARILGVVYEIPVLIF